MRGIVDPPWRLAPIMQTQIHRPDEATTPWLEFDLPDRSGPCRVAIESFPFTIGRGKSTDLRLETTKVSREHAVIEFDGKEFRVRDLQSTNGCFVNSRRITESLLHDGDILGIADYELVFCTGRTSISAATVTQVMGDELAPRAESAADVIRSVRRLQEMVIRRAVPALVRPVVDLTGPRVVGYTAVDPDLTSDSRWAQLPPWLAKADCRAVERKREIFCLLVAEQLSQLPGSLFLFLPLTAAEIAADLRIEFLARVAEELGDEHRLVVEFPESAGDLPHVADFVRQLRDADLFSAFEGAAAAERADLAADFVKVSRTALSGPRQGVERRKPSAGRSRRERDEHRRLIAVGIANQAEADECSQWGCQLAEGPWFGNACPPESVPTPARGRLLVPT